MPISIWHSLPTFHCGRSGQCPHVAGLCLLVLFPGLKLCFLGPTFFSLLVYSVVFVDHILKYLPQICRKCTTLQSPTHSCLLSSWLPQFQSLPQVPRLGSACSLQASPLQALCRNKMQLDQLTSLHPDVLSFTFGRHLSSAVILVIFCPYQFILECDS